MFWAARHGPGDPSVSALRFFISVEVAPLLPRGCHSLLCVLTSMASGVEAKYDTLATRMDRLEAKLDFLISAMSLKYVPATVSKTPEKVGKGKGLSAGGHKEAGEG